MVKGRSSFEKIPIKNTANISIDEIKTWPINTVASMYSGRFGYLVSDIDAGLIEPIIKYSSPLISSFIKYYVDGKCGPYTCYNDDRRVYIAPQGTQLTITQLTQD